MESQKHALNIILLGPANGGKSTVAGQFIRKFGGIDEATLKSLDDEALNLKVDDFKFSWMVDKLKDATGVSAFNSLSWECLMSGRSIILHDGPAFGHSIDDCLKDSSLTLDGACMILSARDGEFEAGFNKSRDQLLLAKAVGIGQFVVAISHMDSSVPSFSKDRFKEIQEMLSKSLTKIGLDPTEIPIMPVSGYYGDGIVEAGMSMPWYNGWSILKDGQQCGGKTLLEALSTIAPVTGSLSTEEQEEEQVDPLTQPPPAKKSKLVSLDDYLDQIVNLWEAFLRNPDVSIDGKALLAQNIVMEGESGAACFQYLNAKLDGRVYWLSAKNLQENTLKKTIDKVVKAMPAILILEGLENLGEALADVIVEFGKKNESEKRSVWLIGTKTVGAKVIQKVDCRFQTIELQLV